MKLIDKCSWEDGVDYIGIILRSRTGILRVLHDFDFTVGASTITTDKILSSSRFVL